MKTTWTKVRFGMLAGLAVSLLCVPAALSAQRSTSLHAVSDRTARILEEEAEARTASFDSYAAASALYRKAAVLRGEQDPGAVADLRSAGRLAHYLGDHEQAVRDLMEAGDRARELGMANATLEAYYEAAWVAQRSERYETAYRLVQRIGFLSRDPDFMIDVEPEVMARAMRLRAPVG